PDDSSCCSDRPLVLIPAPREAEGGVDQSDMAVRLREVPALLQGLREEVLGVEAEAVVEGEETVEELARLVRAADEGERLDEPQRAHGDRRLHVAEVVLDGVAAEETAVDRQRRAGRVHVT